MKSSNISRKISIDNNEFWRMENTNTGARGDCFYPPLISMTSNRTVLDSTDDKTKHPESTVNFECSKDHYFRSNLASGEPEQHNVCFSTSSATFIVSSSPPSEITIEQNDHNIHHIIEPKTTMESSPSTQSSHNYQQQLWFKENWIPVTVIAGMIVIFITVITTTIIY
jgi:hypothetical protein